MSQVKSRYRLEGRRDIQLKEEKEIEEKCLTWFDRYIKETELP